MTILDYSPEGNMGKARKTVKPARKPYRFTIIKEQDREIMEFLDSVPKPMRGRIIVEGLKLLRKNYDSPGGGVQTDTQKEPSLEFKGTFDF
jgi:hypothetical protein